MVITYLEVELLVLVTAELLEQSGADGSSLAGETKAVVVGGRKLRGLLRSLVTLSKQNKRSIQKKIPNYQEVVSID